jgi:hypothetical protein
MELEGSLPNSQARTIFPCTQSGQSGPCPHFLKIQFNRVLPHAKSHVFSPLLASYQNIRPSHRPCAMFYSCHSEEMLAPHPITKLEDHPLPAVWNCLFSLDVCIMHFLDVIIFVQQMHNVYKQLSVSYSIATCFNVCTSSTGSLLSSTLKLQINKMNTVTHTIW